MALSLMKLLPDVFFAPMVALLRMVNGEDAGRA